MSIPKPLNTESKEEFIDRCMIVLNEEYPDEKQRMAISYSSWKESNTEIFCNMKLETKEVDQEGNLIVDGYIATTHLDSGFYDDERGLFVRDKISIDTLKEWANDINEGNPRANKVSVNHNRQPHVAGVGWGIWIKS